MTGPLPNPPPKRPLEADVWVGVSGAWKPLFGSYFDRGISIEWHDFQIGEDIDWSSSFHQGSLEICLNFSGAARFQTGEGGQDLASGQYALYTPNPQQLRARRLAGSLHRFLTVELSRKFLEEQCATQLEYLKPPIREFLMASGGNTPVLESDTLNTHLLSMRGPMLEPPVPPAAHDIWYSAKALEVLSHTIYEPNVGSELFCQRHQRQNRERVERVCYLIERDFENPPSLEMLAKEVSCSTFHLSRIFAETMQMSIPKYLRMKRIEKAAELLKSKKVNVTEAAMAVGYASLSAFNKAFVEQMGCCPGLYPIVTIPGRTPPKLRRATPRKA